MYGQANKILLIFQSEVEEQLHRLVYLGDI